MITVEAVKSKFLVVIQEGYTRDIQIADDEEAYNDPTTDTWHDFEGEVVVAVYEALTESDAIDEAVASGYFRDSLKTYKLEG